MNKLFIFVAVAMLSVAASASSVAWSIDYTYKAGTTENAEGWQVVFFDNAEVARDTFIASLATGDYATYVSTYGGIATDVTDSDGYADGKSKKSTYGNPETITGYFVLFDSADYASATSAYVSATKDATTGATAGINANMNFGDVIDTQSASNWAATAAPEPTSGLLLLLGMAGLALKRKRA